MNVLFRVDASKDIGIGHLMRCRTFALYLKRIPETKIIFVCNKIESNCLTILEEDSFKVIQIGSDALFKKNESNINFQNLDANLTINSIQNVNVDLCVVDHYELNKIWENKVRPYVSTILVIDDLANREHEADYLLDQKS